MAGILFSDAMILDASGRTPFPGEVLVQGNRIAKVAEGVNQIARNLQAQAGQIAAE